MESVDVFHAVTTLTTLGDTVDETLKSRLCRSATSFNSVQLCYP